MDPLSDVLTFLKPRSYVSAGLDAGGDWSFSFPAPDGIKFNAVVKGSCWVSVEGHAGSHRIDEGDCFLLTRGRAFSLASDPALAAADSSSIYQAAKDGIATCNGGGGFFLVGARFAFPTDAQILFGALPPLVHVRRSLDQASVLRWLLDRFAAELRHPQAGASLVADHLVHLMLVQVLRLHMTTQEGSGAGWLYAVSDAKLGRAVAAIHADPGRRWTLSELAGLAGMSRSVFFERFKRTVGSSPIEYLTRWRMLVAGERLRRPGETVATIAYSLGYESESAFSTAFKRVMARSPRQHKEQTSP